uniref:Uncharacterized protein n=1 Tax=Dunaliella tertiolecta TaxID=3047 RepID=A0A7S3QZR0_DUNTE
MPRLLPMHSYLRFLLIGTPSQWPRTDTATSDYRLWAWHMHHRQSLRVWAFVSIAHMLLFLRDIEGMPLKLQVYGMMLLAVFMAALTSNKAPLSALAASNWARRTIVLFSVLQCVVTAHVTFGIHVSCGRSVMLVCSRWLDVATNMIVALPCLALADMRVESWLAFVCLHVSVSTPFYVSIQGYSLPLALFKAAVIQGLILIAYTAIERPKCAAYMRLCACASARKQSEAAEAARRAQEKCASLEKEPSPSSSASSIVSPVPSPAWVGTKQEANASSKQSSPPNSRGKQDPSTCSKQPNPPDCRGKPTPVVGTKRRMYRSMLKRTTVSIKLSSDFGLEVMHGGAAKQLSDAMMATFPGTVVVDMAARQGCIMLSMDVCELRQVTQLRPAGPAGISQEALVQRAIQEWLREAGLEGGLGDGTVMSVQVGDCVRACTWNLHAKVWEMQPEPLCSSNEEQHSIVVPSMALIYPSRLPFPQQQQQPPQQHIQLNFKAYITAPSPFRLTGWYGSEEGHIQEGVDDGNCLQLLARAHGRFLPVDIVQQGTRDEGGVQGVQACVYLPPHMKAFDCCQLRLEVVRGSSLLCRCNTMLVSSTWAPLLPELDAWAKSMRASPDHVSLFMDDLAEWLSFQGLVHTSRNNSSRAASGLCCRGGSTSNNNSRSSSILSKSRSAHGLCCGKGSSVSIVYSADSLNARSRRLVRGWGTKRGCSGMSNKKTAQGVIGMIERKRTVVDIREESGTDDRQAALGGSGTGERNWAVADNPMGYSRPTRGSQGAGVHSSTQRTTHGNGKQGVDTDIHSSTHSNGMQGVGANTHSTVHANTHGSRQPPPPSFLAALVEEAHQPEALQMMARKNNMDNKNKACRCPPNSSTSTSTSS